MKTGILIWYLISTILLALLLFKPVKKFIFVGRVRRAEKRLDRKTTEEERIDIEKKSARTAMWVAVIFSILFNSMLMGKHFKLK